MTQGCGFQEQTLSKLVMGVSLIHLDKACDPIMPRNRWDVYRRIWGKDLASSKRSKKKQILLPEDIVMFGYEIGKVAAILLLDKSKVDPGVSTAKGAIDAWNRD